MTATTTDVHYAGNVADVENKASVRARRMRRGEKCHSSVRVQSGGLDTFEVASAQFLSHCSVVRVSKKNQLLEMIFASARMVWSGVVVAVG